MPAGIIHSFFFDYTIPLPRLAPPAWHFVLILAQQLVLHMTATGPFLLRPYQTDMKRRIFAEWELHRSLMVQMPTGTGKTHLLASVIRDLSETTGNKDVWIIAHRRELVEQIEETVSRYGMRSSEGRVKAMSIQWLSRHWDDMDGRRPGLIVVDEAHHALAATYKELWKRYPEARKLGMTATPCRLNRRGFTDLFEVLIASDGIAGFIRQGWLSAFDYVSIRPDGEDQRLVDSLSKRGADGDFQVKEMDAVLNRKPEIGRLYESMCQYARDKKGIVYAVSIGHARNIAEYYNNKGVSAAAIDSKTPAGERKLAVNGFRQGRLQVLVNVDVFSEGFDCPDVEFIQLARPTLSLAKYLQQVGRGLRRTEGKEACVLIDNVGLYRLFGLPSAHRDWAAMFEGRLAGKGHAAARSAAAYMAEPRVAQDRDGEGSTLEMVVSHEQLLHALEQEDASAARDMPSREALKPFKDRQSGLWGLRRGAVLTAPPRYAAISATKGDFAAVKFGDGHMAVVDDSGRVRMELGRHRRARFLPDDLMALTDDNQPDTYIDLRNGQPYAQRPSIVRFGPIELLRSDGVYYSRTREVFRSPPGTAPYDFVRRSFYLLAYDYSSPPSVPTVDPPDALPGRSCACLLEGDAERYYWFCGKLADGSIVVADNDGNYYHAEKGKEKRRIAGQRPLPGEEDFHTAVHRLKADAARRACKHREERRAEEEKRRQERLAALRQAVPFHAGPKWGLKMGDTIVVPPIYRNIQAPVGYFCAVECNPRQWGVIMLDGKMVVEARYANVEIEENGTARLTLATGKTKTIRLQATR